MYIINKYALSFPLYKIALNLSCLHLFALFFNTTLQFIPFKFYFSKKLVIHYFFMYATLFYLSFLFVSILLTNYLIALSFILVLCIISNIIVLGICLIIDCIQAIFSSLLSHSLRLPYSGFKLFCHS